MQSATASLALSFPLTPGASNPLPGIGYSVALGYSAQVPAEGIPIYTAETYNIDLAMMPATGLQALLVSVDKIDPNGGQVSAPIKVVFTGGFIWLGPGGACALATPPLAVNGITSVSIVTTAPCVVHVTALG